MIAQGLYSPVRDTFTGTAHGAAVGFTVGDIFSTLALVIVGGGRRRQRQFVLDEAPGTEALPPEIVLGTEPGTEIVPPATPGPPGATAGPIVPPGGRATAAGAAEKRPLVAGKLRVPRLKITNELIRSRNRYSRPSHLNPRCV